MLSFLTIILLLSFFLSDVIAVGPNLYPLRIITPILFLYAIILLVHKSIVKKELIKIPEGGALTLLFFVFMVLTTFAVSAYRQTFLSSFYELNVLLNYLFVITLIVTLIAVGIQDKKGLLKKANGVMLVVYFVYLGMALYEIKTGFHFPISNLYDASDWMKYSPTVVYFNSNDFAAVFTMMFMFLLSNRKKESGFKAILLLFIVVLHAYVLYKAESRLSLLVFGMFILYRYPKQLIFVSILSVCSFVLVGWFGETSWFMQSLDGVAKLKQDLSFEERNSTLVRLYLYKHAMLSVFDSYGLGFGVNASEKYYQSVVDPNLFYITNPHSYIFEILINSGVFSFLFYFLLNAYLMMKSWVHKNHHLLLQLLFYNLLLFSSSSSLFLWPIYLFFILYVFECDAMTEKEALI